MTLITTQEEMRNIAAKLILKLNGNILEIGCSSGNFTSLLYDKIKPENYLGIDILKDKIEEARKDFPKFKFLNLDICKNLNYLEKCDIFCSFQVLEHIGTFKGEEDCKILLNLKPNTKIIISVPNSPYKKEHKRWFELDGWKKRYSPYINFDYELIIQNPIKKNKRSFLLKGVKK